MSKEVTIELEPESELAQAAINDEIDDVNVIVAGRRVHFVKEKPRDYWETTTLTEHFAKFRHILDGIDSDELKADIYRRRREGSRHPVDE